MGLRKFFLLIVMLMVLCSCYAISIYQHELVHLIIDKKIGSEAHLTIADLCGLPAFAVVQDTPPVRDLTNAELANSFNESISYNLSPLLIGIMGILILGFVFLIERD